MKKLVLAVLLTAASFAFARESVFILVAHPDDTLGTREGLTPVNMSQ